MTINVNGQQYASWAHVPPEIRARLAHLPDKDGDGVPDVLQGDTSGLGPGTTTFETTTFSVNGVQYDSFADLPAALRAEWDRALGGLGGAFAGTQGPAPQEPTSFGRAPARTAPSAPSRPTMMNGQPYDPAADRKRWWQFWK